MDSDCDNFFESSVSSEFQPAAVSENSRYSLDKPPLPDITSLDEDLNMSVVNVAHKFTGSGKADKAKQFTTPRFIHSLETREAGVTQSRDGQSSPSGRSTTRFASPLVHTFSDSILQGSKRNLCGELQFPSCTEVDSNALPTRQICMPAQFHTVASYQHCLTAALHEHLNIMLFELSSTYHSALNKVDISQYLGHGCGSNTGSKTSSRNPPCQCGVPAKMLQVKKEGSNKGRFFYACEAPRTQQCKFFQWLDQSSTQDSKETSMNRATLSSADSITTYVRGHGVRLYCGCSYLHRSRDDYSTQLKKGIPAWVKQRREENKKKITLIKLNRKDASSYFSKGDLWVVSRTLQFDCGTTFIAQSTYYGPNSSCEVEVEPLAGFSASKWANNVDCHVIHAGNASTELACLQNLTDHVQLATLPILPHLLDRDNVKQQKNLLHHTLNTSKLCTPGNFVVNLAEDYVNQYKLNPDQADALMRVAAMMNKDAESSEPVLLIHGVFGAGKSFLLSVIIRFLVDVFEKNDSYSPDVPFPWKLLLASTTNVAVDRVLAGLLELGFEDFIRVGSVKKIAKPVLPYSVHASGSANRELTELQEMLRSDIPPSEKQFVRRSIEKNRLGENKRKLSAVRVVGVTCAACSFHCLNNIHFSFVVLDECSQMTEPASLLPIARFQCEKLVLVGDPKQLSPTIQGSEAGHCRGLEQTLSDRMFKLGYSPVLLRTQYRCHPWISQVASTLFYSSQIQDGVTTEDRAPLTPVFPTVCFYDEGSGQEQPDGSGSYYNEAESRLVVLLLQALLLEGVEAPSIGVITLYKAQMYKIITSIHTDSPALNKKLECIQVSTVDAFQGAEKDVIILSCVRTNNCGFIDSDKRTNVALTRARHHLLIVGHQKNLSRNKLWSQVIQHFRDRPNGVQKSALLVAELRTLIEERQKEKEKSQNSAGGARRKRKKRPRKDSPPMSLSGGSVESSGQCVQTVTDAGSSQSPDLTVGVATDQWDAMDTQDFVLSEHSANIPREAHRHSNTRKRPRRSHVINTDTLVQDCQESSDEDLPGFL